MNATKITFLITLFLCFCKGATAQNQPAPTGLTVNLLTSPGKVLLNGYPVNLTPEGALLRNETFQFTEITTRNPLFGWIVPGETSNTIQTAYQILVADNRQKLSADSVNLWNSGKIASSHSTNITYKGKPFKPGTVCYWKVKIWDNHGKESSYSDVSAFKTSDTSAAYATDRYPVQKRDEYPWKISNLEGMYFADFGKAAFGRIRINLFSERGTDTVVIHLGEAVRDGRVDRNPGGTIRYSRYTLVPEKGRNTYIVTIPPDARNTGPQSILVPEYIGEVTPFRYCEIENYKHPLQEKDVVRETAFYPFNEAESYFRSSDTILNRVWEISKYSIKATSFLGVYVDGDRERIPYEADALINQLSHYCVTREYNMARYTHEYLIHKPTWPTEWILQSVLMAWEDYFYTGDSRSLSYFYDDLKAKTLSSLADKKGFISTRTGKVTPEVLKSIYFDGQLRDIVDWPHTGILGLEKEEGGETDGFVFTDINTVVNAFHYRALTLMAQIAKLLGKDDDHTMYLKQAARLKRVFNDELFDKGRGYYVDGIGTSHASLHANMFPLAFGLVEAKNVESVLGFIRSRGMACSVYGAQFLLDAVYNAHDAGYGLQLLTSTGERSWYNMIRSGSTITMEAWDNKYKPNQDWNHAWGAVPANIIPRKLMGIEPLEPGFGKIRIRPQPGSLEFAEIKHPTIRGDVSVSFTHDPGQSFQLEVHIPANTTADLYLPFFSKKQNVQMNKQSTQYLRKGNFSVIENVGSGKWIFTVER
jgi:hypothetical protein